ncbi:MAG TPA: diaminopropionate ammonia-lyase [Bryobacteraceae bacterium]|nr:diaminopropionate ammonia-lyase [Bryobacteraceae bacterium]
MRWRTNRFFDGAVRFPQPDPGILRFHESLAGYQPTSLNSLDGLADQLGVGGIRVKDESQRFGLNAFKGLGASWAMHRFLEADKCRPVTFATATDGNHGRAVAWAARLAGQRAVIFVPRQTVAARIDAIRGEGAKVVVVDGNYDDAVGAADTESRANGWQVLSDTAYRGYMEIPEWVIDGYSTMFREMEGENPDMVIVQAGVGGLAAAAVRHFFRNGRGKRPVIVCVQPEQADGLIESASATDGEAHPTRGNQQTIMAGLACGMPSLAAWPVVKRGAQMFLSIADKFALDAMRRFYFPASGDPRITSGETGAAGLAGLIALCREPQFAEAKAQLGISKDSSILLINTEGDTDPENFRRLVA